MRPSAALLLAVPALLVGQAAPLDGGRLEAAWFGPAAAFSPSPTLGLAWVKPGLDLQGRALHVRDWQPAVWLLGKRAIHDEHLLMRMAPSLVPGLAKGLAKGLKGALPVSRTAGDVFLLGRAVDASGGSGDAQFATQPCTLTFDLKLVDADSGELLAAFHHTLEAADADFMALRHSRWSEDLGRLLGQSVGPRTAAPPKPAVPAAARPVEPPFDLEGALRRIEGLKRDGLLSEAEGEALRRKAAERAKKLWGQGPAPGRTSRGSSSHRSRMVLGTPSGWPQSTIRSRACPSSSSSSQAVLMSMA